MKKVNKKELHSIFLKMKENKQQGFNELYEKYNRLVYQIAFSIINHKEKSEDIMQNVFTKILDMKENKLPNENESSWLYAVTKNEAIDYMRKQKNEINIEDIYYISESKDELLHILDKDKYNKMISRLNEVEQEIVSLKIIGGFSFKEIANILKMPMGTVQWKYYNALHSLKMIIGNVGILIFTTILYITRRNYISKQKVQEDSTQNQEQVTENKKQNNILEDSAMNSSTIIENTETNTIEEIQNETISDIQTNSNIGVYNEIDIGLITLCIIFLIFTIIFSIIFIKNQQNRKKKTSKE